MNVERNSELNPAADAAAGQHQAPGEGVLGAHPRADELRL